MPGTYKQVDHTADIAFEITGESLEELFTASARAWRSSVLDEYDFVPMETKRIELNSSSLELLLVDFLSELNYNLFTLEWLFSAIKKIDINVLDNKFELICEIKGLSLLQEIKIKQEIKAITFHQMDIKNEGGFYSTLLVFDI